MNPYDELERNSANYVPLSPLSFIRRTAAVFPDRLAIIYGTHRQTWKETFERSRRLASALTRNGIGKGDTVAVMLPNIPAMFEAHFGVPATGAVLNTLNTRLDSASIAFMLKHGDAKVILYDPEYADVVEAAVKSLERPPLVISVPDNQLQDVAPTEVITYEDFLKQGNSLHPWDLPVDEWDAIALNYTSGTTGNPKGVVTHHRGAYLNACSNVISWQMPQHPIYLWTLPMFHCNGWCFPWTMALVAGTSVCTRRVDPQTIYSLIREHHVTHMCGAPIVYSMLGAAPASMRSGIEHTIQGLIAGAAPPAAVIESCESVGIKLTHVYGLTEVYGPAAVCAKQPEWELLPLFERARLNGRQGVSYPLQEAVAVLDPLTLEPVTPDGESLGEIFFRGNVVMKGYLKNAAATSEAFAGGWFHTGDLAVVHPDGYIKIRDRSKDVIISGGENISSLEVEDVLHQHPCVLLAAVVAMPDTRWGEVPCAFIELKSGLECTEGEFLEFCRTRLARFKLPKKIVFGELPKTSTGKVQKFILRDRVASISAIG